MLKKVFIQKTDNSLFSRTDTNILKAIAVLFMILHHTVMRFYSVIDLNWYSKNATDGVFLPMLWLSTAGKVCVCILTFLSGYGLSISLIMHDDSPKISDNYRFITSHIIQFYSAFWVAIVVWFFLKIRSLSQLIDFYTIRNIPNTFIIGMLLNLLGISDLFKINHFGDWFVLTIIIMYFLFPVMFWITKKIKWKAVVIASIPYIWYSYRMLFNKIGDLNTVRYYIIAFEIGIYFAQIDLLSKLKKFSIKKDNISYKIISFVCLIVTFALRLIFAVPIDLFFALAIVVFEIFVISKTNYVSNVLSWIGQYATNMWLLHFVILQNIWKYEIHPLLTYLLAVLITLLTAFFIEQIKNATKYNLLVKKIRIAIYNK